MITTRKYQNEKPVDTDLFDGQGHKQVAQAIARVLLSDSSQHIIGIEGNLGSGKSTVISILQQDIVDKGFHVVTFDADQYQSTLKSALIQNIEMELEILIGKKDKYNLAKLGSAVETALGKRLEYTKDTTSHISFSAIIFAFSLGVSALQLKPSLKFLAELAKDLPNLDKLSGWLSIALFTSPVLVYLALKVLGCKTRLGDLVKRNSTDTISETIDVNREVGAIELKEAFGTFSSLIPKEKTLLLVVDNIDRVSPDIARELWSDIEILTSLGSERFRILLPYSEEHLAKALEKSAVDESQSGKEFISKRIPVPFSAPPIVTIGWRSQFEEYWNETLPDITGQEGVKDLIEIWAKKITPRSLKNIVNRIGAKIDSCPEPNELLSGVSCAAYLMIVRDNNLSVNQLLSEPKIGKDIDVVQSDIERKLKATHKLLLKYGGKKDDWAKQIAALHFQTSFTIAQSELIAEPIRTALKTYDADMLVELSSLLGFDVLFRQQLATTNASDLVKITDYLVQTNNGLEVAEKYLNDINHELKNSTTEGYDFDEDLIESYRNLQDNGVSIDHKIINERQKQIIKSIGKIWKVMEPLDSPSDLEDAEYKWEDLENAIKQCYAFYLVTGTSPHFINNPTSSFVVNALFPIKEHIKQWDVLKLIQSLDTADLVIAASKRQKLLESEDTIFPILLEKNRIGELHNLGLEYFLADIDIKSTEADALISVLPFTIQWNEPQNKACYQQLVTGFESHKSSGSLDEMTLNAYTALCAASLVNELNPTENVTVLQNGQRRTQKAAAWLLAKFKEQPDSSIYLTDYLSFCKFEKVLTWCKNNTISDYLLPHLEELIDNKRICRINVNSLLTDDYVFLKDNTENLTPGKIINWMNGWHNHAKNPLNWNHTVVEDIIQYESLGLLSVLTKYFDNPNVTKEEWLERIKAEHPVFSKVAYYLHSKSRILDCQKNLQQALKALPEEDHNYNIDLIKVLIHLIDGKQRNGIRISLMSAFFKTTTSLAKRYRIIRYFGSIISMPTINDSVLEMEAIALLDDSINNDHNDERNWLLEQTLDENGWNISQWSLDGLIALNNVLSDAPDIAKEKLTKAVADRVNKDKDKDKDKD
ncbi:TPA: P-loop NTPase fold protein [Vibrio diabolicus]|uniref:P-loop NTPase fold protein n=1 Tax=Vibrio sp. J2-3(2022) TaxID=2912261 RepID=UPI001F172F23|nr:P-loop NTPase fold protein [Vibrio sp. J2-3(2022)]MCF7372312.1 KAP family NTPase [Vibrio sp. J2-3(2022)]